MTTATNLLMILLYLSALYSVLGLICGIVEKAQELMTRPRQRRRTRRGNRYRQPRRGAETPKDRVKPDPVALAAWHGALSDEG